MQHINLGLLKGTSLEGPSQYLSVCLISKRHSFKASYQHENTCVKGNRIQYPYQDMKISHTDIKTAFYASPEPYTSAAAVEFSPVLQGVLDVVVRICSYLAFSLLVFSFSCLLKKNIFDITVSLNNNKKKFNRSNYKWNAAGWGLC